MGSLKKSTNIGITIFIGIKKLPVCILEVKGQSSRVRLSMFVFPVLRIWLFACPQGTILIELKASKRPKRIHACI